jgi:hypothetical protein
LRSCQYWEEFEKPKVVVPAIQDGVRYAADFANFYGNDKTSIFVPQSPSFALAIVNSQVSWWITCKSFASRQGGFYEFKPMYVTQLPIPSATAVEQDCCEKLALALMWIYGQGRETMWDMDRRGLNIEVLEKWLNGLVYELYFPEELHAQKIRLLEETRSLNLPDMNKLSDRRKKALLDELVEKIAETKSRIGSMLNDLEKVEEVRIIRETIEENGKGRKEGPGSSDDVEDENG